MSPTRLSGSAVLVCAALAVTFAGCASDQTQGPGGIGSVDMTVTLATPPAGPNEQIDAVEVSFWCEGIDPVLGVPRPPQSNPETFTINTSTSQGPEPYNTIGLFEKQGIPAGDCHFTYYAVSNTGNTECTGEASPVTVVTNQTTPFEVVLACIHTPRFGGVRSDGTFNQCAEYRQVLVSPTTQAIGNLVDVATEVYDPDADDVTVEVTTAGACGNVAYSNGDTAASCETVSGCQAVLSTVECTDVGPCQITVAVSDDGFDSCNGFLPDGSNNDAARTTIAVDCTIAAGCGNGVLEPGEDCDPPDGVFCDENCQDIDPCADDPCNQSNVCSPEVCSADANNQAVCTPDPGSAAGNACSPPAGGTCDGQGNCVACQVDADCEDNNECTDNFCVAGACEFPNDDTNTCSVGGLPGNCNAGVCEGLCTGVTCPDAGECVTNVCDPADGECKPTNDPINTGCDLVGAGPGTGVCDGAGACVECNMDSQCDTGAGETCVNNVCEAPGIVCEYEQDFEALDPADPDALANDGWLYFGNVYDSTGGFKFGFGPFPAPTTSGQISGIASGEGGPDQGNNQLVVFSNYDCCQPGEGHFGTDLVETIVFQEINPIPADFIGKVFTFEFDAKRGNIEGATTAQAFIRTLDPGAGFATTNNIVLDTTSLPTSWGTYSIQIDLSDPALQGQILQFGFSTVASNFEGAGNFYDNISFCTDAPGGQCVVNADCPDDGNECTAELCNAGTCESANVADGTDCDGGAGTCQAGVCQPTGPIACEYQQDFEALDPAGPSALGDDGWLYFGNVYDSGGGFKFGFGPFVAPTTSGQISGIATGEGGPDQGNNQLVVFSNYDCCQPGEGHFGTDLVETIVFQEIPSIPGSLIGQVLTFEFDAKRGNIGGATTAQAFIRTLDPGAGFATTNNIVLDTTALPTSWGTYSIQIDLSDPALQGQILQFGFSTVASNFEGAGNFYDNITFGQASCSGGGGGPGGGELTVNGDFEAGDTSGWEFFPNDGTFAATMAQNNGGLWSGNLVASVPAGGGPPSFPVIKQANIGVGSVQPNSSCDISFDLFGSVSGAGGVFFAEFFSELTGGGTSSSVLLGGGPLFPTGTWTTYTYNTPTGNDVSGGVTLQLKADCGANPGCTVDAYIDNVSVTCP